MVRNFFLLFLLYFNLSSLSMRLLSFLLFSTTQLKGILVLQTTWRINNAGATENAPSKPYNPVRSRISSKADETCNRYYVDQYYLFCDWVFSDRTCSPYSRSLLHIWGGVWTISRAKIKACQWVVELLVGQWLSSCGRAMVNHLNISVPIFSGLGKENTMVSSNGRT